MHCRSEDQTADIFTKALKKELLVKLRELLGLCNKDSVKIISQDYELMLVNIDLRERLLAKFILLLNLFFQESWPRV